MNVWHNKSFLSLPFFLSAVLRPWNKWQQLRSCSKCFVQWSVIFVTPCWDASPQHTATLRRGWGTSTSISVLRVWYRYFPPTLLSQARWQQRVPTGIRVGRSGFLSYTLFGWRKKSWVREGQIFGVSLFIVCLFVSAAGHSTDTLNIIHLNFIKVTFCWGLTNFHYQKLLTSLAIS